MLKNPFVSGKPQGPENGYCQELENMIVAVSPGSEENIHKVIPTPRQVLLTKSLPYYTPNKLR
jgi:hypothetical protein